MSIFFVDRVRIFLYNVLRKEDWCLNTRIKKVRKESGLTQDAFAERLSLTRNYISLMEKGDRVPSDRTISDICREFGISEKWLRYNEGDMKIEDCKDNRYFYNVGKLQRADDETIMRWVNAIAETDPKVLKQIEEFMKKLLEIQED